MTFGFTLQDKFGIFIALIVVIIIAGLSFFFYLQIENSTIDSLRVKLAVIAKMVARQIDPNMIEIILTGDEKSRSYWDLKNKLKAIQLQDPNIKSIYVMVRGEKENLWKFVADQEFNPREMAHLNEEYDVSAYPEMKIAFGGAIADKRTTTDKWGRWLSGYAPVYDRRGHAIAIVGVNMGAREVDVLRRQVRDEMLFSFMIGLALAIIFGRIGAITITNPIMALAKGVKNIEEGRYGYKIDIRRRDEIGLLVEGFNRMSDKISEVDRLKSDFMSVISHELYAPITPIKDAAGQLKEDKALSATGHQLVSIIERQISKMQNLVDELLDFSWMEIRDWKLEKEPVSPQVLSSHIAEEVAESVKRKKLNFEIKLSPDLPSVMVDKKRIHHVLKILLDNAIKFTPEEGRITLQVHKLAGGLEFAVADTGIGINPGDIEKIFSGFYQAEEHLTRTKGGVGLGLAIAKRIVEAHNGTIWAESPGLGAGSRFLFLLPIV